MDEKEIETIKVWINDFLDHDLHEVVELNVHPHQSGTKVQVLLDRWTGGISVDECSKLNRYLSQKLEESLILGEHYSVEVSSPGIDRPLETKRDFERVMTHPVRIYLKDKVEGKIEWVGLLTLVEDDFLEIYPLSDQLALAIALNEKNVGQKNIDVEPVKVPINLIKKGIQIF